MPKGMDDSRRLQAISRTNSQENEEERIRINLEVKKKLDSLMPFIS
jgi:hypothetical protein